MSILEKGCKVGRRKRDIEFLPGPTIDPLVTIYYVQPYRKYIVDLLWSEERPMVSPFLSNNDPRFYRSRSNSVLMMRNTHFVWCCLLTFWSNPKFLILLNHPTLIRCSSCSWSPIAIHLFAAELHIFAVQCGYFL